MPTRASARGVLFLLCATALWGSTVVVVQEIQRTIPSSMMNFARFAIAAIALTPFIHRNKKVWAIGLQLGVLLFISYATQSIGLKYTSVNRSAFITAMNVIFVPILSRLTGAKIPRLVWAAALVALFGCGLLCNDGKPPNIGDLWTLFTALTWAAYIVRIEHGAQKFSAMSLAITQMVPLVLLSFGWAAADHSLTVHLPWWGILYLGLPASVGTTCLQAAGQRTVPPAQAAVIFTLEPVFAMICGYVYTRQMMGTQGLIGAGLIVSAALLSQLPGLIGRGAAQR